MYFYVVIYIFHNKPADTTKYPHLPAARYPSSTIFSFAEHTLINLHSAAWAPYFVFLAVVEEVLSNHVAEQPSVMHGGVTAE